MEGHNRCAAQAIGKGKAALTDRFFGAKCELSYSAADSASNAVCSMASGILATDISERAT